MQIKGGDILLTYIGMLSQGKTEFEVVKKMVEGPECYRLLLGISRAFPPAETLRQRISQRDSFLREKLKLCHQRTDKPLLIRQDSGNDAAENNGIVLENDSWFIVKRNPRRSESKEEWIDNVKAWCRDICHPREGKTVYAGTSWKDITYQDSENKLKTVGIRISYKVTKRATDKNGKIMLAPDTELNTWWTNLGLSDNEIIRLYHAQVSVNNTTTRSRQTWT